MVQGAGGSRLAVEPVEVLGRDGDRRMQDLEGDLAMEARVPRAVYLAHAAHAEEGDDLVGAETATGGERNGGPRPWLMACRTRAPYPEDDADGHPRITLASISPNRAPPTPLARAKATRFTRYFSCRGRGIRQDVHADPEHEGGA